MTPPSEVKEGACCVGLAQEQEWRRGHEGAHADIDSIIRELRADIKEIKDSMLYRLPLWATLLIASLTAAIGWFAKK